MLVKPLSRDIHNYALRLEQALAALGADPDVPQET